VVVAEQHPQEGHRDGDARYHAEAARPHVRQSGGEHNGPPNLDEINSSEPGGTRRIEWHKARQCERARIYLYGKTDQLPSHKADG
jgi:hypothetical protein